MVSSREDETQLVRSCLAGKDDAWEKLLSTYAGTMLGAIRSALRSRGQGHDPALAEEILTDAFAALAEREGHILRAFRGESSLATFLGVIATRRAFRSVRGTVRRSRAIEKRAALEENEPRAGEQDPAETVERAEDRSVIVDALAELAGVDRMLLTLYYLDGRSYAEIAAIVNVAETGVGTRIARARARLRKHLEARGLSSPLPDADE